jgi:hypothetical protein
MIADRRCFTVLSYCAEMSAGSSKGSSGWVLQQRPWVTVQSGGPRPGESCKALMSVPGIYDGGGERARLVFSWGIQRHPLQGVSTSQSTSPTDFARLQHRPFRFRAHSAVATVSGEAFSSNRLKAFSISGVTVGISRTNTSAWPSSGSTAISETHFARAASSVSSSCTIVSASVVSMTSRTNA